MPSVLALLRRDHENLERLLRLFERELDRVERAEAPDYDVMVDVLDYCANFPDRYHHPLEDRVLAILSRRDPDAAAPVGDLDALHAALAAQTQAVLDMVRQARQEASVPRAALLESARDFVRSYRDHMASEDKHFFPAAEKSLTGQDWTEIETSWMSPFDPVFGGRTDAHYRQLRRELLSSSDSAKDG